MYEDLAIILYPDPRLKKVSKPVVKFDDSLRELVNRMFQLMRDARGVGLAAPQVGQNIRLFVMNHSGELNDDHVYINPQLSEGEGSEVGEEGCLSLPGIHIDVERDKSMRIRAFDVNGKEFEETASGFVARIWQHEFDHLNGTLLTDRMGTVAKMTHRKALRELEEKYEAMHPKKDVKKHR
jgi:peptide deformylase